MTRRLIAILLLIAVIFSINPLASVRASGSLQSDPLVVRARAMLAEMTHAEIVGQLFLVTFKGAEAAPDSQIYDLIVNHHIGGVMLVSANDNFAARPNTTATAYQLISQLQNAEFGASQTPTAASPTGTPSPQPTSTASKPSNYIPLFVGISQDGDGYPDDQILNGLTSLPSLMAVGATWQPSLAGQVGLITGQELSALGFNLFLGPSLDVLESPESTLGNGLDANVFGGDPYWVGAMGSAYIEGLHTGSGKRMIVVADHFPGRGSADRPAGQEPATVRKSLEQLKQIELAPFFTVTGNAQSSQSAVDGLLVSHIRYQGFQGNIRSTTRPVSFDPQALAQILLLPAFAKWHQNGGLLVSDDLGSPTVRSFYDPGGQNFSARMVARDAFLAGNDLLYMGNITSTETPDNYSTVVSTLDFFTQKYEEDTTFARRVDEAVTRILAQKYKLYNYFSPSMVIPNDNGLGQLDQTQSQAVTSDIARRAATLISPTSLELDTVLPNPPGMHDQLVFLTDTRVQSQCSKCGQEPMMAVDSLQKVIMRLYGPQSGGQVMAGRMISYGLDSIGAILPGGSGNEALEASLKQATWVVINILDAEPGQSQTTYLRRFLSERQDILRDKHVIVFGFNAPYFLDATDISQITAYYCLYSKSSAFIETAARLLFREVSPVGILPVSVSGIGYDLLTATSPDPDQEISISLDWPTTVTPASGITTPEPTSTPHFTVGQAITVRTGVIVDHNGLTVPDGTGVQFIISISNSGVYQQIDAATVQGVAAVSFNIPQAAQAGSLEIRATSDPAFRSISLGLNITSGLITFATPTEVTESTATPTLMPTSTPAPTSPLENGYPGFGGWFSMLVEMSGLGMLAYWLGESYAGRRWGVRAALCAAMGGLLTYTYLAVRLPGAAKFLEANGWAGIVGVVLLGSFVGVASAFAWYRLVTGSMKRSS